MNPTSVTPATVLTIDDDSSMRRVLDGLMLLYGFTPLHAATTAEAMASADEHQVDAFILDLKLGADSGLDLLTWLRQHPKYRLTPVFILTGAVALAEADSALIKDHWAFVFHKGHSLQVLMEYMKRVLNRLTSPRDLVLDGGLRLPRIG